MAVFLIGTGTTISFATGFLANVLDISGPNASRESIECSVLTTTIAHEFTPALLVDWGEVVVEMALDPATKPPVNAITSQCVLTFTDGGTSVWTFDAFMTGFEPGIPLEDRVVVSGTLKVTGDVVFT